MTSEVLQELDLSQGTLCQYLLTEDICNLLNGNPFPSLCICGSTDDAICALSQFFRHIVSFIHDEILVEDFEDLAASEIRHIDGASAQCSGRERGIARDASISQMFCERREQAISLTAVESNR